MVKALRSNSAVLAAPARNVEPLMLSAREMQTLIEATFLHTTCKCEVNSQGVITLFLSERGKKNSQLLIDEFLPPHRTNYRAFVELVRDAQGVYCVRRIAGEKWMTARAGISWPL